jgi:hypothetical protein
MGNNRVLKHVIPWRLILHLTSIILTNKMAEVEVYLKQNSHKAQGFNISLPEKCTVG